MGNPIEQGHRPAPQEIIPAANALDDLLHTRMTRRQAIGALTSVIALSLVGCRGDQTPPQTPLTQRELVTPPSPPTMKQTEATTPQPLSENQRLIRTEIQKLGIAYTDDESRLWQQFGYKYNKNYEQTFTTPESQVTEAEKRIDGVLTLMYNSKNTYLKKAADDFAQLKSESIAGYVMLPDDRYLERQTSLMETGPEIVNGNIVAVIQLTAKRTLSEPDDPALAIFLAHEIEHVRSLIAYDRSLSQSLTAEQKLEKHRARRRDKKEYLAEEARGYAIQAQAYIVEYRFGFTKGGSSLEGIAADFIRSGSQNDSPDWVNKIEDHLRSIGAIK